MYANNKVKYVLSKDSPRSLYSSLIVQQQQQAQLTCCVEVWCNAYKYNLNPLYAKEKHLIHLISKAGNLVHIANMFESLYVFCLSFNKVQALFAALTNAVCLYNASFLPLISANAFYFHALSLFIDT